MRKIAKIVALVLLVVPVFGLFAEGDSATDTLTIMLPGDVPLEFVLIPSGSFLMGHYPGEQDGNHQETPQHSVTIGYNFYMGKYELTKRQWEAVMGTTPWSGQPLVLNDPDSPAVYVSWDDIRESSGFLDTLNAHVINTGQGAAPHKR